MKILDTLADRWEIILISKKKIPIIWKEKVCCKITNELVMMKY